MHRSTEGAQSRAEIIYSNAFWNALGHGMNESEADLYATKKVNADKTVKIAYRT